MAPGCSFCMIPVTRSLCCVLGCCAQDSDHLWRLSPPARAALQVVLSEPAAALRLSWAVTRTAPLASGKGGPECAADVTVTLAGESRQQLLEVSWRRVGVCWQLQPSADCKGCVLVLTCHCKPTRHPSGAPACCA